MLTRVDDLRRNLPHVHDLDPLSHERNLPLQSPLWRVPGLPKNIGRIRSRLVDVAGRYMVCGDFPMQSYQRILGSFHTSQLRIQPQFALREHGVSKRRLGHIPGYSSDQQNQDPALALAGKDWSCICLSNGWIVSTRLFAQRRHN